MPCIPTDNDNADRQNKTKSGNRQLKRPPRSHVFLAAGRQHGAAHALKRIKASYGRLLFSSFPRELIDRHGYGDIIPAFPATRGRGFCPETPAQVNIYLCPVGREPLQHHLQVLVSASTAWYRVTAVVVCTRDKTGKVRGRGEQGTLARRVRGER